MTGFREFFTEHAEGYTKSESHARGSDLGKLLELLSGRKYRKALDIATGPGFTAMAIASVSEEVIALDPTPAMLQEARKNAESSPEFHKISFVEGLAEDTGFPDGTFDLVTCRRAAHHFPDKPAFLREVRRILRENGVFVLVDMLSPDEDSDNMVDYMERLRDHSHVHAASRKEWISLMEDAGFRIVEAITEIEKRPFEKWLFPVETDSLDGKKSRDFVEQNKEKLARAGGWDLESDLFVKQRGIIKATPASGKR